MSPLPAAIGPGRTAVVTGAGSGIGRAAARRFAELGMRLALVDADSAGLAETMLHLGGGAGEGGHATFVVDVADRQAVDDLARRVADQFGSVSLLMNNAGVGSGGGGDALANPDGWMRVLGVNLLGVLHGVQAFAPAMADSGEPGLIINTGSKQGITQPPGDTAYNVSKSGVKALTEGLAHTLRNKPGCQVTAHLLIPGFAYTGMTARRSPQQPPSAWTPEQVVDRMLDGIGRGDFYVLCQDNETTLEMDQKRILWSAQDLIENRPALSRWDPAWKEAFDRFMAG